MLRRILFLTCALITAIVGPAVADAQHRSEVDAWHAGRIENLRRADGWLTLVGLFALPQGQSVLGSGPNAELLLEGDHPAAIAQLTVADGGVRLTALADVMVDGVSVDTAEMLPDVSGTPTVVEAGSLLFYVIERDGKPYLRVKDRSAPLLQHFEGIERWPVTEDYLVPADWIVYDEPRTIQIPSVLGYATAYECPGEVRFEIDGKTYTLQPSDVGEESMFFVFGDATNGVESYGAGRFLVTPVAIDGHVTIDFNRAYNPPCVFTPFATCPLPPEGNTLEIELLAGEKMFGEGH